MTTQPVAIPTSRADLYNQAFPRYPPLHFQKGFVYGVWMIGACYKGSGYYGQYPYRYLDRVMSMFPDAEKIMHLFSGVVPPGPYTRVDVNPGLGDVAADAQDLPFDPGSFDLILADPPYSHEDAARDGTPLPNMRLVLRECARVLCAEGNLVWLDTKLPMWRKQDWKLWGTIGLIRSTNHRMRLVSCFEKRGSV